jgi:uncharacterized protein
MKVLLDTNILLVIIPLNSKYRLIFDKLRNEDFDLIISNEILFEYEELITRFYSKELAQNLIEELLNSENVICTETFYKFNLITQDYDDNKFVDAAISANADFIVTQDKHFNILNEIAFPKINIINITDFINLIS